jgi:hypothetical protein
MQENVSFLDYFAKNGIIKSTLKLTDEKIRVDSASGVIVVYELTFPYDQRRGGKNISAN